MQQREPIFNIQEMSLLWMIVLLLLIHFTVKVLGHELLVYKWFALLPLSFSEFDVSWPRQFIGLMTREFFHLNLSHLFTIAVNLMIFGLITFQGVRQAHGYGRKGSLIFWAIFFGGIIFGGLSQWLAWLLLNVESGFVIGATAGVAALFAAAGWVLGGIQRLLQFGLIFMAFNLATYFFVFRVALACNIGGFVAGAGLAVYWLKPFSAGTSILR